MKIELQQKTNYLIFISNKSNEGNMLMVELLYSAFIKIHGKYLILTDGDWTCYTITCRLGLEHHLHFFVAKEERKAWSKGRYCAYR